MSSNSRSTSMTKPPSRRSCSSSSLRGPKKFLAMPQVASVHGQKLRDASPLAESLSRPHPRRRYSASCPNGRQEEQRSGLVSHPQRAAWLASKGLKTLTLSLDTDDEEESCYLEMDETGVVVKKHSGHVGRKLMLNPFTVEMVDLLVRLSHERVGEYLGSVNFVINELNTAIRQKKELYTEELQQILNATADIGHSLAALEPPNPQGALSLFEQRMGAILKELVTTQSLVKQQDDSNSTSASTTVLMLMQQAKCLEIILLLFQLHNKEFWTYDVLRFLMHQLWSVSPDKLSREFLELQPLYDLACSISQMPQQAAVLLMASMPLDVRSYALLFLSTNENINVIRKALDAFLASL